MRKVPHILFLVLLALAVTSCNQPFEPDGPVSNKLVVYSILDATSSTQYVRVGTTYETPPGPAVHDAFVILSSNSGTTFFRDSTVSILDPAGVATQMNVFIAPRLFINPGTTYTLTVGTFDGLRTSVSTTTLSPPTASLTSPHIVDSTGTGPITLKVLFRSFSGAAVLHFYVDYYAYVDGGWEFHHDEIPQSSSFDNNGIVSKVYPSLALVKSFALSQKAISMQFDPAQYSLVRTEATKKYPDAPVIWLQAVFVLTQIDDALYNYYYVNNGPVDKSSIRLDQPDFTNIPNGLGVFGNSLTVTMTYPIRH